MLRRGELMFLALFVVPVAHAAGPSTFCNPVNINYRFSMDKPSHREAADPTMVVDANGTYWLFASKSGGYWHSTDMNNWTLVVPTGLPLEDYAPMVVILGDGRFYYTAFGTRAIYRTDDPYSGEWSKVADMKSYSDPGMLVDDDGRVYMYSGCSDNGTINAVELNNATWQEEHPPVVAIRPASATRGFEVGGDNNDILSQTPWVEGAFMNKIRGKYYLQYAVPGTQYKSYADGLYVGNAPLGPFVFHDHSPLSSRLVGFAAGAGHGSTYAVPGRSSSTSSSGGAGGNGYSSGYYHIATSTISVRHRFERRLVIYPLIDANPDLLWVDSYLGDYPQPLPHTQVAGGMHAHAGAAPRWMLLSLNKAATASSGSDPALAFNEDIRTWWSADSGKPGEWLAVDLGGRFTVNAVQTNFADQDCTIVGTRPGADDAYRYFIEYRNGTDTEWKAIEALNRSSNTHDVPHDYVELPEPLIDATHLRITNLHMPGNARFSISGLRVFGLGPVDGAAPDAVPARAVVAVRDPRDPRHVTVSWAAAAGAEFYVIRYGIKAKVGTGTGAGRDAAAYSTVHNLQVYGATSADIRSLVTGEQYEFVVDAINSNGVTYGEQPSRG